MEALLIIIFYEVLFWIIVVLCVGLFSVLWALLLPVVLVVAVPVILVISAVQKKPAKRMLVRFIEWWADRLPVLPDFTRKKKSK